MGFLGGESTEDTDLRPGLAVVGIAVGVAVVQVAVFPHSSEVHWLRFAVELLLIPIPVAGAFVVGGVRHVPTVWRPLYAGTALFAVYAVSDAVDEVVAQPEAVTLVFEDGTLLVGSVALAVGAVRWSTHRDARETELRRRNDRLDQFASVVTHDLRNPLNVAQMRLELAREGHGTEHLSTVADAHDRMEALIQDVLQLARVGEEVGEVEPVSLATVAADAVTNTSLGASGLTVEADARLLADRGRLTAVFENLFRNAVEHGSTSRRESPDETASRDVPTETPSPAADKSAADASGRRARADADGGTPGVNVRVGPLEDGFFVEDDGPGIPPEEQDRIFESGYSTDSRGTGLGLAIVAGVADAHGWEVAATTGKNGGARFEFRGVSFAAESEVSTSGPRP
ncbi:MULTISPECIES: sensor histidine kinase [Haloferax]|uniref:sensor histidine kinase n=1 Tax=Haloferax TaxID=2251 RepID=UPI000E271301|nr:MULTISPECIES: HAMP domain-containing sensor histidine kinase [Haloferax]RDZ37832.1 sensor histidine kinase [Haloferax sp. Atlit-24N]RDZ40664.1 sensor histidine kinase [Haloferax sp. Atlit-47N]RLM38627.1 sensor histidine kinase [Haloferax sp. Atlit-109R]RLM46574.1 sensor histidine kinase [Haloferax sp. Atlit-105R]WEL29493.1 Signal transduction histidine kinase [Haloferax alexandrinus]